MKKLYSMMMLLAVAICASFTAKADVSATLTWDTPGSVVIYVGSTAESSRVELPAGATSYDAVITGQTYGSVYARAAEGYMLEDAVCEDDGKTIAPSSWGTPQISVNMSASQHGGHRVKINCSKLEYDGSITVNLISAGDVTATINGTSREVKLNGGENVIPLSTKFDKTVNFSAPLAGSSSPYVKKGDTEYEWKAKYAFSTDLSHDAIDVANGDVFTVKYNDEAPVAPVEEVYYKVSLNFLNEEAKQALQMIRNVTQSKTIAERESFQVLENDKISMSFNAKDYTIEVDGKAVEAVDGAAYSVWYSDAITSDTSISISAAERAYEPVEISFMVNDPECVEVHDGEIDGEIIDLASLSPTSVTYDGVDYKKYNVSASGKYKKLFIVAADNCWVESAGYGKGTDYEESGAATPEMTDYRVVAYKIVRDKKLVVYVDNSVDLSKATLKDKNLQKFDLQKGYNEFLVDPKYSSPMTVAPIGVADGDPFNVQLNYAAVKKDADSGTFKNINLTGEGDVIHVFMKNLPTMRTVSVEQIGVEGTVVTVDNIERTMADGAASFKAFNNFAVTVKPADASTPVLKDNEPVELTDGAYTFKPTANTNITVGDVTACTVSPSNGSSVDSLEYVLVTFPYATSVEYAEEINDYVQLLSGSWANWGWTVEEAEAEQGVAFKFIPSMSAPSGAYRFVIFDGFFKINGSLSNGIIESNFTYNKAIGDVYYDVMPTFDTIVNDGNGIYLTVAFDEELEVGLNTEDINDFKVQLGDKALEYYEDYDFEMNMNYFMINIKGSSVDGLTGTLSIEIKEGALSVSGAEAPAISHSWTVVEPKEFAADIEENWTGDNGIGKEDKFEVIIRFTDAKSAELYNQYGATMYESAYPSNRYHALAESIESVAPEIEAYADNEAAPAFKLTFPSLHSVKGDDYDYSKSLPMELEVRAGTFLLDGYANSPAISKSYDFMTSGVSVIEIDSAGAVRYFNIQGVEVINPSAGQVYIKVDGGKTSKVQL